MKIKVALVAATMIGLSAVPASAAPSASDTGAIHSITTSALSATDSYTADAVRVSTETVSQRNAKNKALSYLRFTAFSRSGLIEQLKFEGFSAKDAKYAVDAIKVNWNLQAKKKAKSYLSSSSFSRTGLINQLKFEGFTSSQATYGVNNNKINWNAQAAKKAKSYLAYSSFSRSALIDQLIFEGFTSAQATYGVNQTGL